MRKILRNITLLSLVVLGAISCSKEESKDLMNQASKPATIEVLGDNPMFLGTGANFVDPGVNVADGKLDGTVMNFNNEVVGSYFVQYLASNDKGLVTTAKRSISVIKSETPLTGAFKSGTYSGDLAGLGPWDIESKEVATGVIYVSDMFAGYYEQGRSYGEGFRIPGMILHKGGDIYEMAEEPVSPWGNLLVTGITIDFATNKMSWNLELKGDGYNWNGLDFTAIFKN